MAAYPSIPIAFPFEEIPPDYGVVRTEFDDGYVQTRAKTSIGARGYRFSHETATAAEVATFNAFWNAQKGGALAFDFTDPRTGTVVSCRFKGDRPKSTRTGPNTYSIGPIELEEKL